MEEALGFGKSKLKLSDLDFYIKQQSDIIEDYQETAKKFENFFGCEIAAFNPGYVFYFPEEDVRLEIPRWFVQKFNRLVK
jgi:hypothetical protein